MRKRAKEHLTHSRIPGINWTVNQYVGCAFACNYCYAKLLGRWKDHVELELVGIKTNAPNLTGRHVSGSVVMSTVNDPYQHTKTKLKFPAITIKRHNHEGIYASKV